MTSKYKIHGRRPWQVLCVCLVLSLPLVGCGREDIAPVSGTVTSNGTPVKGGTLIFSPIGSGDSKQPGQAAVAEVQADGTYVLKTGKFAEGALLGRHRVTYTPPVQVLTEQQRTDPNYEAPLPPYIGLMPKTAEVEVEPGSNTIDVELVPAKHS